MIAPPPGFVLDTPPPPGFVLDPVGVDARLAPAQNLMQQLETAPRFTMPETFTPTPPGGMEMPTAGTELAAGFMDFARFAPLSREAWTGQPPQGNVAGLYEGLAKQATPENAAIMALALPVLTAKAAGTALGPVVDPVITGVQSLMKALFATQGAGMAGSELGRALYEPELSPGQRTEALFNTVLGGSLAVPGFMPMLDRGAKPSGLGKGDIQSQPTTADFANMTGKELIGPERQLTGPRGEFVVDPLMQVQAKADVDPLGGQVPYQTVEPKKAFSGDVPILGDQPTKLRFPMVIEDPVQLERAYQAAGEPKQGGQISFASPAEANAVPSARQAAINPLADAFASAEKQAGKPLELAAPNDAASLPAGAKMIEGEGQSSTQSIKAPHIEDAKSKYDRLVSELQAIPNTLEGFNKKAALQKQIEALKNENGGMPPTAGPIEQRGPQGGNLSSLGFLDPAFWKSQIGIAKSAKVDAQQLVNRMRNKLGEGSAAWDMLKDDPRFKEFMVGVRSPEEVEKWINEERPVDPTLDAVRQKAEEVKEERTGMRVDPSRRGESGSILNPFKPRARERQIDTKQFRAIQKFFDYGKEVQDATTPQGIGRVPGLSRLFDPRAYRTTPDGKAIIANAVMSQKGQNFAALWQETHKDVVRAFENVPNFGDVIEAELREPGSQKLNANQKKFVDEWAVMRKKVVKWAQSEGVLRYVDEEGNVIPLNEFYFPRPAVGKVGVEATVPDTIKQSVGGKQFMQKARWYESEAEGTKAGIKYDPDEFSRIGRWMTAVYKAVADQRMADDPALKGVRDKGSAHFLTEGKVFQPAFAGRIYPKEVANRLNKYYGESTHDWVKKMANINDALKSVEFTMDVSAPVNQGLPLMGSHPIKWAKTTLRSYQAMLDDRVLNRYLQDKDNARIAREIVANGGSLVRLQDFLQGANKGKLAEKVPPIRASARSMGTFFSLAKIELYRAYEPIAKKHGWSTAELVEAVENSVLSGKMENLGLTRGRALGERLLFNAPSYIRGAFNLIAMAGLGMKDVATGKPMRISGRVANRALAGLATAVMLQMYALYKMKGLSDEEVEKRFDPREGSFLKYPHMMSNGVVKEVGYNNFIIGLARVLGDTVEVAQGTKEVGTGMDNPWIRWTSYRKSPIGNLVWQYGTGVDYRGEEIGMVEATAKAAMPIAVEPFTERDTTEDKTKGPIARRFSEGRMKGAAAQFLGLSTYDESPGAYRNRQQDLLAQEKYPAKGSYSMLTKGERRQVTGEAESRMKAMAPPPTPKMVMGAQKVADLRRKAVIERLEPGVQEWLMKTGLRAGGYSESTTINNKEVRLANREERERLRDLMAEQVNYRLSRLTNRTNVSQEDVDRAMGLARERAWMLMGRSLGTK